MFSNFVKGAAIILVNSTLIWAMTNLPDNNTTQCTFSSKAQWLASVQAVDYQNEAVLDKCLGTIINVRYVITAAKCISDIKKESRFITGVRIGDISAASCYVWPPNEQYCLYYGVEEQIIHPLYDSHSGLHDVALLRLNSTVPQQSNIGLQRIHSRSGATTGRQLSIFGPIKECKINVISESDCKTFIQKENYDDTKSEGYLCTTSWKNTTETHQPIKLGAPVMVENDGLWDLEAIINSRSVDNDNKVLVHTKLSNYFSWVKENIRPWLPVGYATECTMPDNNKGHCTRLHDCPELLKAFTRARTDAIGYLKQSMCPRNDSYDVLQNTDHDYVVCCGSLQYIGQMNNMDSDAELAKLSDKKYCGYQQKDDHISKDEDISIDEFPWIAQIAYDNPPVFLCSGALINVRYVITKAECTINAKLVRLGEYDRKNTTDCVRISIDKYCSEFRDYSVEERIQHPFYNPLNSVNDIGVLRLNKNVEYTDFIRPICLPIPGTKIAKGGDVMYGTGWGDIPMTGQTQLKKKVKVTMLSNDKCVQEIEKSTKDGYGGLVDEYKMCIVHTVNTTDFLCLFDDGGPIMFNRKNQWHIEGIFAKSYYRCRSHLPSVLIHVSMYLHWIQENVRPDMF